jgi:ABC-type molybdate transport system substrate-binding protein
MKTTRLAIVVMLAALAISVTAQERPEQQAAQQASDSWLTLVDAGRYAESWDEASQMFRNAVTKPQWVQKVSAVRDPLGKVTSRRLKNASYTKTLPGAPDGEYVVIQYDTSFEHKQSAIETVTPMLDKDGKWRVSGYFIR